MIRVYFDDHITIARRLLCDACATALGVRSTDDPKGMDRLVAPDRVPPKGGRCSECGSA